MQNKSITGTTLTNPDFNVTDSSSQTVATSKSQSELTTLPPEDDDTDSSKNELDERELNDEDLEEMGGLSPERLIDFVPLEEGERYEEINSLITSILTIYKPVTVRKVGIIKALREARKGLGLKRNCTISQSFGVLRTKVDKGTQLELVCAGTEPLKLTINELTNVATPDNLKQSVAALNTALALCQKFKGEKELKMADIQYKLEDLHLMPLTRKGQELYSAVESIPSYLEEMSTDIDRFHQQLYEARHLLQEK